MIGNDPSEVARHSVMIGFVDSAEIEFGVDKKSYKGSKPRGSVIRHMHWNHCGCNLENML